MNSNRAVIRTDTSDELLMSILGVARITALHNQQTNLKH